jgi:hypothetical protein
MACRKKKDLKAAAENSVFLGYGDMKSVKALSGSSLINRLASMTRAAKPEMYVTRFYDKSRSPLSDLSKTPCQELFAMLAPEANAKGSKNGSSSWKRHIGNRLFALLGDKFSPAINTELSDFFNRTLAA